MKIFRTLSVLFFLCFQHSLSVSSQTITSQKKSFTKQDSLRGSITKERAWWDLKYYHLDLQVFPNTKFIKGKNTIKYTVLESYGVLQIDLQLPLKITKVVQDEQELKIVSEGNAHFIQLLAAQNVGDSNIIVVYYEGNPKEAKNAPWDGGFSWKKDENGKDFIATSCQGLGASVWWPNKDHMYDEVENMDISVRIPSNLVEVSNGRLISVEKHSDNTTTYNWTVKNPINNYGVNVNIGDYVHFSEKYQGEGGNLNLDYYVLSDHLKQAKEQFKQTPKMIKAFEHWFGKYPFYEDSFKLVEVPYLGMEHQSSVTYGNKFKNGYLGRDLSGTGWGLKFDFIIIHESGHEWFANNITYKDIADMWIHESFTAYSESLYLEYYFGKKAAAEYVLGTKGNIRNDAPIIGIYEVNNEGSGDMYYKGSNMLHTIRQLVNNDEKWRLILRGLNKTFWHQTVNTQQIENYMTEKSGIDLSKVFDQYLRDIRIPEFTYSYKNNELKYKWDNVVTEFNMPIKVSVNGKVINLNPSTSWKTERLNGLNIQLKVDENYLITQRELD